MVPETRYGGRSRRAMRYGWAAADPPPEGTGGSWQPREQAPGLRAQRPLSGLQAHPYFKRVGTARAAASKTRKAEARLEWRGAKWNVSGTWQGGCFHRLLTQYTTHQSWARQISTCTLKQCVLLAKAGRLTSACCRCSSRRAAHLCSLPHPGACHATASCKGSSRGVQEQVCWYWRRCW